MDLRTRIGTALREAMKTREAARLSTLRLINAAIKDRDIALRGTADERGVSDEEILGILGRMVRQREDSARSYEEGGRLDLAERERAEIAVIEAFLPRQLDSDEIASAIDAAIAETGAQTIRDMGAVMALLKSRHTGRMDFSAAGPMVRAHLTAPRD